MTRKSPQFLTYTPLRSLIVCLLITTLPWVLLREFTGISVEDILIYTVELLQSMNSDWTARFSERLINEPFKLFLVWMALVVLCYAFFQYLGLIQDSRYYSRFSSKDNPSGKNNPSGKTSRKSNPSGRSNVSGKNNRLIHLVNRLSGRPKTLFNNGENPKDQKNALHEHIEFGENALMAPLRFCLSAFPMLGFLGTVVGLSGAIRHLPKAMQSDGALQSVLDNLYVAFDTTFLGLTGALMSLVLIKFLEIHWDKLGQIAQRYKD